MIARIFADTSGLYAALVRNDSMHPQAGPVLESLLSNDCEITTTSYVVLETVAILQARVGLEAARQFQRVLMPALNVVWIDERLHAAAFHRLETKNRREVSLVDCSSFVVMEENELAAAFVYDPHFTNEGFRAVRSKSDLGAKH